MVAALRPPRVKGRQALCEVMFAFHDAPMRVIRMPALAVEVTPGMEAATIAGTAGEYERLLTAVTADPEARVSVLVNGGARHRVRTGRVADGDTPPDAEITAGAGAAAA